MVIKGVSEVVRLLRLGKIRLGINKENDTEATYPTPSDYFVCPDKVEGIIKEKPKDPKITFPTKDEYQWVPDPKMSDDLFPQEILEQETRCVISEIPTADEALLQTWHKVKKQLKKRDVQSVQVSLWFDQLHDIEVNLSDFEAASPPSKFTMEMLSAFYDVLLAYEERLKQEQQD